MSCQSDSSVTPLNFAASFSPAAEILPQYPGQFQLAILRFPPLKVQQNFGCVSLLTGGTSHHHFEERAETDASAISHIFFHDSAELLEGCCAAGVLGAAVGVLGAANVAVGAGACGVPSRVQACGAPGHVPPMPRTAT